MNAVAEIRKFYAFAILFWLVFWQPVIVLFWLENGLTLTHVFIAKAVHSLVLVISEVPSGAVADRFGKRNTLLLGTGIASASLGFYIAGQGFPMFLAAEILAAISTSMISGTDSSFVHDMLAAEDKEDDFSSVIGRAGAMRFASQAVGGLIGGFVAGLSLRLTLVLTLVTTFASFCVIYTMRSRGAAPEAREHHEYSAILRRSVGVFGSNKKLMALAVFSALLVSADLMVLWVYQPYMEGVGLAPVYFGVAYLVFNFGAAFASHYAAAFERNVGSRVVLIVLPVALVSAVLLLSATTAMWGVALILILQAVRGLRVPVLHRRVLSLAPDGEKTTVLSVVHLSGRLLFFACAPAFGWMADEYGISVALRTLGIVWAAAFLVLGMNLWNRKLELEA